MPKLLGVRERRHQPYWDTLIQAAEDAAPANALQANTRLFNGRNLGQKNSTNMNAAGSFPSDNTYIVLSMRCWMHIRGAVVAAPRTPVQLYKDIANQLFLCLNVGDKPQFDAQAWYFPAGGGITGFPDAGAPQDVVTNGVASHEAILKLAKPIPIPARQHFFVAAEFFAVGANSVVATLNLDTDIPERDCKIYVDGIHTRDVL